MDDGGKGDKNLLGGKGTNVDGMPAIGLPVPPGFTITIEMRTRYYQDGSVLPKSPNADVANGIVRIEGVTGKITVTRPIRCSSPSARARAFSCQQMDTVLNLGLNDETALGLTPRQVTSVFSPRSGPRRSGS